MAVSHRDGENRSGTVSFAQKLASSRRFKDLFQEGMALVDAVAAYLDGPGRQQSKNVPRPVALAYAAESMRLTTRLMQIASWLLVQKAINEGDMTPAKVVLERNKVQMSPQGIASHAHVFAQLPETLQEFVAQSLRIQTRIIQFDAQVHAPVPEQGVVGSQAVHEQLARLTRAFPPSRRVN